MAKRKNSKSKTSTSKKRSKKSNDTKSKIPSKIFAQVSPKSIGGTSMFEAQNQIFEETVPNFFSEEAAVNEAVARLEESGFDILQISPLTINISGTRANYKKAFGTEIVVEDRPVIKGGSNTDDEEVGQFLETMENDTPGLIETEGTDFANSIEGIALEEPRYYMAPSMYPPLKEYWHLDVPAGISLGCNADKAHRTGITGKGVKVAMVDTGWYKHPFFTGRGYNAAPVTLGPGTSNPLKDESGHGTGESANIFAVAPDVKLFPVKMSFFNSIGSFNAAVGLNPDIITCSWGSSKKFGPLSAADMALATSIAAAVASGITVVFAAGNSHWGFPGQHPDVISAGGVFMDSDESLQASNYSSGFMSNIYANRRVPDLSGLVGQRPKAIYIMLPLEPKDQIDVGNAGGNHPNGDETKNNDGWAAFSGTSAAAPQLAGAAALVKQACSKLKPKDIRSILMKTASDVTAGNCHPNTDQTPPLGNGNPATSGPDIATGNGLVNAHKAAMLAKIKCLGLPIVGPIPIVGPAPVVGPQPIGPAPVVGPQPIGPAPVVGPQPIKPIRPIKPAPIKPIKPIAPVINPGPIRGLDEAAVQDESASEPAAMTPDSDVESTSYEDQTQNTGQLSEREVDALEDLIINSDFEID